MNTVKDVVCGMDIPEEGAEDLGAIRVEHEGRSYWLCCPTCEAAFRKNPDRYVEKAAEGHSH